VSVTTETHATDPVRIDSVMLTLIEQVDVPAADAGVLASIDVTEGQVLEEGAQLAKLEDGEARQLVQRAKLEFDISRLEAANELKVRYARKTLEVAQAELKRATESIEKYRNSVSQSELDALRLAADGATLEVQQAEHDLAVGQLTAQLKENELQLAINRLKRRQLLAPISGVVVQIKRHRGEWVQPGESVVRLVRIDRLRAEGFLSARESLESLAGAEVMLSIDLPGKPGAKFPGKIAFVSPEVNPVNGQARFWAEIENVGLALKPGLHASLTIDAAKSIELPNTTPTNTAAEEP
jgi:macrolide-specific efflux system membrane fusion protein